MNIYEQELKFWASQDRLFEKLDNIPSTIMISGATGMVGKCLVDLLMLHNDITDSSVKVIALSRNAESARKRLWAYWDRKDFQYISCDINQGIPECGAVDYIIHGASNTHPMQYSQDPIGTIASNVIGTKNLLDYAASHRAQHFCFLSTVEIYGENRGDTEKFDEKYLGYIDCNTLRAGYPESKRLGETLCNAYHQAYDFDFSISRLSRIYGPTMLPSDSKAIAQFIKKAAAGEDIVLKSEGNQKFSYTFVTDVASAVLYTMLIGEPGQAYNAADECSDITLKDLAAHMAEIAKSKVVFELPEEVERRGYSTSTKGMLDAAKLRKLGWTPRVHIQEGLKDTINAFRKLTAACETRDE